LGGALAGQGSEYHRRKDRRHIDADRASLILLDIPMQSIIPRPGDRNMNPAPSSVMRIANSRFLLVSILMVLSSIYYLGSCTWSDMQSWRLWAVFLLTLVVPIASWKLIRAEEGRILVPVKLMSLVMIVYLVVLAVTFSTDQWGTGISLFGLITGLGFVAVWIRYKFIA